jgi:hypothetical protein
MSIHYIMHISNNDSCFVMSHPINYRAVFANSRANTETPAFWALAQSQILSPISYINSTCFVMQCHLTKAAWVCSFFINSLCSLDLALHPQAYIAHLRFYPKAIRSIIPAVCASTVSSTQSHTRVMTSTSSPNSFQDPAGPVHQGCKSIHMLTGSQHQQGTPSSSHPRDTSAGSRVPTGAFRPWDNL